jgi:energy-coupling factor transporter ATP-binding protein EcfA2
VLELNRVRGAAARQRSSAMLAEVGLGDRLHSAVDQLSGGEQQRVAIARALVHEPALLLADEPTGNLDEETAREVFPVLVSLTRARGATLLIVTHDGGLARSVDRVLELREGRLREVSRAGGVEGVAEGMGPARGAGVGEAVEGVALAGGVEAAQGVAHVAGVEAAAVAAGPAVGAPVAAAAEPGSRGSDGRLSSV